MRRRVAIAFVACCGLFLLVFAALHTPPVRSYARRQAEAWLRSRAGIDARIGALSYNLARLTFVLNDVRLAAQHSPGSPFLTAARVNVTVDGIPPWRPFALRTVAIDDGTVLVQRDAEGRLNFPPGRRNDTGAPPPVAWTVPDQIDLRRLHFIYRDDRRGFTLNVPSAAWSARQNLRGLAGTFSVSQFASLAWPTRTLTLAEVRAHVTWTGNRVVADAVHAVVHAGAAREGEAGAAASLTAPTGGNTIGQLDGHLTWDNVFGASAIDAAATGPLSVDTVARWFDVSFDVAGPARWRAALKGPPASLVVTSHLDTTSLTLRSIPNVAATAAITADFARGTVSVDGAHLALRGGEIDATALFPFSNPDTEASVSARWARVPWTSAMQALHLTSPVSTVNAAVAGTVSARWRYGEPRSLVLAFDQQTTTAAGSALDVSGHLQASAANDRLSIAHEHSVGPLTVAGSARSSVTALFDGQIPAGPFTATADDAGAVLRDWADAALIDATWPSRLAQGRVDVSGDIAGTWSSPRVNGTLLASNVKTLADPLTFDVHAPFVFSRNRLDLSGTTVTQGGNRIDLSGDLDFARRVANLNGRGTLENFDAIWQAYDLPAHLQPAGRLTVDVRVSGGLSQPVAEGQVTGDVTIGGLPSGTLAGGFHLTRDDLKLDAVRLNLPSGSITAEGTLGFSAARPFDVSVATDITRAEELAAVVPGTEWPFAGRWQFSGNAKGSLSEPTDADFGASISRVEGTFHDIPVSLDTPSRIERSGDRITVSPLTVTTRSTTIWMAGALGPGTDGLTISSTADLADLAPLLGHGQGERRPSLSGQLQVEARARGTVHRPSLEGWVRGQGLSASVEGWPPILNVNVDAALADGLLSLNRLEGIWQEAEVRADARAPLSVFEAWLPASWLTPASSADPARLNLGITGLTAPALAPFVSPSVLANIGGRASLHVALEAPRLTREAWKGELVLDEAELTLAQVPLRQSLPTRLLLSNGRVQVDTWNWEGPGTQLAVVGGVNIGETEVRLDAAVDANIDLRMASAFLRPAATAGRADISVSIGGPVDAPIVEGRVAFSDGEFRSPSPRLAATELRGFLLLIGDDVRLEGVTGQLNGGALTVEGTARLNQWHLDTATLSLMAQGAAVEYPEGLRSELVVDLQISKVPGNEALLTSGTITALRGNYREQFGIVSQLFSGGTRTSITPSGTRASSALGGLRLNIGLATLEDISVETDQGRVEAGASLRLSGTIEDPALSGRIALRQGGTVFLGGTTYRLESGSVEFRGGSDLRPELDVVATTQVGTHSIRLEVAGPPNQLRSELTSDTGLDRSNIVSLLVTGRTIAEGGLRTEVVGSQVLNYLSGDFLNFAGRALGLDSVRIGRADALGFGGFDPFRDTRFDDVGGIAGETDPSSRLTVSKNLTRDVEVLLSQDLSNNGRLTWIATWRPRRGIAFRVLSLDDTERVYEFRQERTFGGPPERTDIARQTAPRIVELSFSGTGFDPEELRGEVKQHVGHRFDFYTWQDDRDRLLRFFHRRSHLEASVTPRRRDTTEEDGRAAVALSFEVRPGPRSELVVEGQPLSASTLEAMQTEWTRAVFDDFLRDDLARVARRGLAVDGYFDAVIDVTIATTGSGPSDVKTATVVVKPGQPIEDRQIVWVGNEALDSRQFEMRLDASNLRDRIWLEPAAIEPVIRDFYAAEGYLSASVRAGQPTFDGSRATLTVTIAEGPPARLATATFEGVRGLSMAEVSQAAALPVNDRLHPSQLELARRRIEDRYLAAGFNDVRVDVDARSRADGLVDASVMIDEGPQQILSRVELSGATRTDPDLVSRALNLPTNEPLSRDALYEARRRLYQTEAFSQVDIDTVPAGPAQTNDGFARQPVTAKLTLVERPLWRFRYGLQLNDVPEPETDGRRVSPGTAADLERTNLFGRAITIGTAVRYERSRQAIRGYLLAPRLFNLPVTSAFFVQEELEQQGESDTRITRLSFEQRYRAQRTTQIQYGYFYRRARFTTLLDVLGQPLPVDVFVNYGGLYSAVSFDRRDDPFDPMRGWFHSSSLEYAARALGSDLRFIKWVAQQSYLRPAGQGVVLAWSGRIGLAEAFGQNLVENERFFAGGGGTVRGYREDSLAPQTSVTEAGGGEALLVLNHELRFPIWNRFSGVAFLDAGNAFTSPTAIRFGELQVGAGLGVRVKTPVGLVRFDFGVPTDGGGLRGGRWHFAFGQMF